MTKRIFKSVCVAAMGVFLASLVLFLGVLYRYFSEIQQGQLRMQTNLAAQGAAHEGMHYFEGLDVEDYRITWIDRDGTVLYDSRAGYGEMENHLEREEIRQALQEGQGESARYSQTLLERSLYCARRLPDGTVLRLSIAQSTPLTLVFGMLQPICMIFAAALILSLVLAGRLSRAIVKPLNEMDLENPQDSEAYEELLPLLCRIAAQQRQIAIQQEKLLQDMEEKENAQQLRREFTANVSHELKTPLHTISGSAELLANGMVKEEDIPDFSRRIYTEAQRMIRLVEDILKLSRLDEGVENGKWEETDLYSLAREALDSLLPEAGIMGVSLELAGESVMVYGVPQALQGIVFNLCDNAVKYNRRGGSVLVTVETQGEEAVFSVKDTGIGILPQHQERIFERFYRVDKSHSKEIGGTGLGLSIVKHGVKLHHGEIDIRSTVNGGTTITVRFPLNKGKS